MSRVWSRLIRGLMVISLGVLPGSGMECDWEDGEFEWDFDGYHDDFVVYEPPVYVYDPFYPCCF